MTDKQKVYQMFKASIDKENESLSKLEEDHLTELEREIMIDIWSKISKLSKFAENTLRNRTELQYQMVMTEWRILMSEIENL